ncbi:MAG: bifunctional diaminohydroxyphosphoribosylaminopyrimidine deaminase/5-amino-6-(5-phosphoribosylamino)uracil reductase RibD [Holophaga sp.]|nr:bifunctional diaminohydroxyphosphoribosylaminopyrimidine deaminase/5-amino-6-(5-phosphoribosylamino)uracil reductase RibD [Holophaga sp.]
MSDRLLTPDLAWELACGGPFPDPVHLTGDESFMALALREGMLGVGLSSPNPPVGCVLVRDGRVLGRGVHTRAGDPHGEIMALRDVERRDEQPQGATVYVTLEPCCYQGRTPPCTSALIRAGVKRVVVGVRDPNPRVDGGGLAILAAHGVEIQEGVLGQACARFHAPFFKLIHTGLPWVMLKLALGSDGAIGPEGQNTQVTNPEVQHLAHSLRRASEAIVVGRWTVQVDDPLLTDRWPAPTAPHRLALRVVLDSHGRLPEDRKVWQSVAGQPVLRVVVEDLPPLRGVEDLRLPPGPNGCSLRHLLHELAARGVGRVLFEGGGQLARTLLEQGLVDEFHRFTSDSPAHGTPVDLNVASLPHLRAQVNFKGGRWEVLARR